jgi:hypothetical protein
LEQLWRSWRWGWGGGYRGIYRVGYTEVPIEGVLCNWHQSFVLMMAVPTYAITSCQSCCLLVCRFISTVRLKNLCVQPYFQEISFFVEVSTYKPHRSHRS